jgi:hypothetical protein
MTRRVHHLLVSLAVFSVLLSGCGSQQNADSLSAQSVYSDKNSSAVPKSSNSTKKKTEKPDPSPQSPFDAYTLSDDQIKIVRAATDKRNKVCMAKKGFKYSPPVEGDIGSDVSTYDPLWGPLDPDAALQNGYRAPAEKDDNTQDQPKNSGSSDDSSHEYIHALINNEDTGCEDLAYKEMGYNSTWFSLIGTYDKSRRDANTSALNDSKVTGAIKKWSICVKSQGYKFEDPRIPAANYLKESGTVSKKEKQQAFVDARCKVSSKLMDTVNATVFAYETQAVKNNQATMDKIKELSNNIFAKAQQILAESDSSDKKAK